MPACVGCSFEAVSYERLQRAVKADIGKGSKAATRKRHRIRRPETHEAHVLWLRMRMAESGLGIGGQIAGEDGEGFIAVEVPPTDGFPRQRIANDAGKRLAIPLRHAFLRRPD